MIPAKQRKDFYCQQCGSDEGWSSRPRRALTSVAIHNAYRPYWARSASASFNKFGSTIGSNVGISVFHEFGPGLGQIVKNHAPKFVSGTGERITNELPGFQLAKAGGPDDR